MKIKGFLRTLNITYVIERNKWIHVDNNYKRIITVMMITCIQYNCTVDSSLTNFS